MNANDEKWPGPAWVLSALVWAAVADAVVGFLVCAPLLLAHPLYVFAVMYVIAFTVLFVPVEMCAFAIFGGLWYVRQSDEFH